MPCQCSPPAFNASKGFVRANSNRFPHKARMDLCAQLRVLVDPLENPATTSEPQRKGIQNPALLFQTTSAFWSDWSKGAVQASHFIIWQILKDKNCRVNSCLSLSQTHPNRLWILSQIIWGFVVWGCRCVDVHSGLNLDFKRGFQLHKISGSFFAFKYEIRCWLFWVKLSI